MAADKPTISRRRLLQFVGGAAALFSTRPASAVLLPPPGAPLAPAVPPPAAVPVASAPAARPFAGPRPVTLRRVSPIVRRPFQPPAPAEPQTAGALFRGLGPGTRLYGQWTIVQVHAPRLGAVPVVLEAADGSRFQVDVCRKDARAGAPQPVASTGALSFFLANKGDGRTPSSEQHGLGAIALATVLGRREGRGVPAELLTLSERGARFPGGGYAVPV